MPGRFRRRSCLWTLNGCSATAADCSAPTGVCSTSKTCVQCETSADRSLPTASCSEVACPTYDWSANLQVFYGGAYYTTSNNCPFCLSSGAIVLDGSNDYVDLGSLTFGGDLTYSAWISAEARNSWSRVFDFGNGAETNNHLLGFTAV
eukprot:1461459-Rhodomonas_salina.3